jgi:hypothetical protein
MSKSKNPFFRRKKPASAWLYNLPVYLSVYLAAVVGIYTVLDKVAHLDDGAGLLISFRPSPYGVHLGVVSIGYLTIALAAIFVVGLLFRSRAYHTRVSRAGIMTFVVLALITGGIVGATQTAPLAPPSKYHASASADGFTMGVYYNATTVTVGKNLTFDYYLIDNSYSSTLYYQYYGGEFSMVISNSSGTVEAMHAPISFSLSTGQDYVEFSPGETWSALLSWNGVVTDNGTSRDALPGSYTLSSYAVLQDGNVSLYADMQTANVAINVTN